TKRRLEQRAAGQRRGDLVAQDLQDQLRGQRGKRARFDLAAFRYIAYDNRIHLRNACAIKLDALFDNDEGARSTLLFHLRKKRTPTKSTRWFGVSSSASIQTRSSSSAHGRAEPRVTTVMLTC